MEKIKCSPQEASRLKVIVGSLIDNFPTGRIRNKDMDSFNVELNRVMTKIIDSSCFIFSIPENEICGNCKSKGKCEYLLSKKLPDEDECQFYPSNFKLKHKGFDIMKEYDRNLIFFARWVKFKYPKIFDEFKKTNIDTYKDLRHLEEISFINKHYKS